MNKSMLSAIVIILAAVTLSGCVPPPRPGYFGYQNPPSQYYGGYPYGYEGHYHRRHHHDDDDD